MLEKEFQFYLDNQDDLVKRYKGKYIVIKGTEVIGTYDNELTAYIESVKVHAPGTFLIQLCESGDRSYTQIFHSRVSFV